MNCVNDTKEWVIYDAKLRVFTEYSHEEFKDFINNRPEFSPIKFKDVEIWDKDKGKKVWIDGLINSEDFK